jgi:hypothetical protein
MSIKKSLFTAAALLALGAAPAMAQGSGGAGGGSNGDVNINQFLRQSPDGMVPTSNGVPRIVDNREGQPVIRYSGPAGPGVQEGGTPRIVDNRDGNPVISYGNSVPGDVTGNVDQQVAASQNGLPANMQGRRGNGMGQPAIASSRVTPLLSSARTSLQRGRYAAAASTLERAETQMLNSGAESADIRSISEARAAAHRGDRNSAMQSLNSAMQQTGRRG